MRKYNSSSLTKKQKRVRRFLIFLIIVVLIATAIILYFDRVINPIIISTSETRIKMLTSRAVNSSISELLSDTNVYDELITISTNDQGQITLIQANAVQINNLSKSISQTALSRIESIGEQGISIPLGTFSGLPLLAGKGPDVIIKMSPIGTLDCVFKSEFVQAGINQTLHRIYLDVSASVNLILPIFDNNVTTYTQVMICESVIVGDVPEFYFNNSMGSLLDLVPDNN